MHKRESVLPQKTQSGMVKAWRRKCYDPKYGVATYIKRRGSVLMNMPTMGCSSSECLQQKVESEG